MLKTSSSNAWRRFGQLSMEKLQNWKPLLFLTLLGGVAGAIVSISDLRNLIAEIVSPGDASFVGKVICSTPSQTCLKANSDLETFLDENVGKTVSIDFQYEFSAAGSHYANCIGQFSEIDLEDLEDGGYRAFVPVSPSDCGEGFFLGAPSATTVTTAMARVVFRVKGEHTVQLFSFGGAPLYRLLKE
ncbi:hypothetical protein [uncultured Tateyamaria sp.]|uniref:hypothetical protein n=1 Tax=uncultured Tateyamaria sp. TaxID=455651 RepID=UPI00261D86C4|nr:hypothetical protein [uncultured Tateyamaria sp.]